MFGKSAGRPSFFNTRHRYLEVFLFGALMAATFMVIYIILDGGPFIFYGDFNVQQIPFYIEANRAVRSGAFFWNSTTDLGVNFIGSYSFYLLGSPFFWLTTLIPMKFVGYSLGFLYILKFACASLTGYIYIQRFVRNKDYAMLGALMYAFSGFAVYNIFFNHFHEAIVFFPLLLIGIEMIVTEEKCGVFAIAVFINAFSNYYFFFGEVIFCVLYYVVRCVTGGWGISVKKLGILAIEAVIGLFMAGIILIPSIYTVISNPRVGSNIEGWNALFYSTEQRYGLIIQSFFFPPDIPARPNFFPSSDSKWASTAGWLPLFSMAGVIAYMKSRKKDWLKRMIGWCIFIALIPCLNAAFSALNYAYYSRWFYMPVLLMALATTITLDDEKIDFAAGYRWTVFVTLFISVAIGFMPHKKTTDGVQTTEYGLYNDKYRFFIYVGIAVLGLVLLAFLMFIIKRKSKSFTALSMISLVLVVAIYANAFILMGRSHSYDRTWIKETLIDQTEGIDLPDEDKVRVDVYQGSMDNIGLYWGLSSIQAFHSLVPSSIMDFYDSVGVDRGVGSRPEWEYQGLRSLLSVKYLIDPNNEHKQSIEKYNGWSHYKDIMDYTIYENENYIPMGFTYDQYVTQAGFDSVNEKQRNVMFLKAMLLSDEQIRAYGNILKVLPLVETDLLYVKEDSSAPQQNTSDDTQTSDITDQSDLSDSDTALESGSDAASAEQESDESGYISKAEVNDSQNDPLETKPSFSNSMVPEYAAERNQETCYYFEYDNNGFTAKINLEKRNLVFFSVPWEQGWSATVNGEKAVIERVNKGFMAVLVEAGQDNEIRFTYKTPGLAYGVIATAGSTTVFAAYIITVILVKKRKKSRASYEESNVGIVTAEPDALSIERASIELFDEYVADSATENSKEELSENQNDMKKNDGSGADTGEDS